MQNHLAGIDIAIMLLYAAFLIGMAIYFYPKCHSSKHFMIASSSLPSWAVGCALLSTYMSSISYISTPGKAFDANWHPMVFAISVILPIWLVSKYIIPYYHSKKIISVFTFLEDKLGVYARLYASIAFLLLMVIRTGMILYIASLVVCSFLPWNIYQVIICVGLVTICYTLLGGMEAIVWTDVLQTILMVGGILFCLGIIISHIFSEPKYLIQTAIDANKFSLGGLKLSLTTRTVWVMFIFAVVDQFRALATDQNYVQKYATVSTIKEARQSLWLGISMYIPMTAIFLFVGTGLYAFYSPNGVILPDTITKGDQVFPYFIATQLPAGLRGLILSSLLAAVMSTVDSQLNSSATVLLEDYVKRFFHKTIQERGKLLFLRIATFIIGLIGIFIGFIMVNAQNILETNFQVVGICGSGILGLFLIAYLNIKILPWQGILAVITTVLTIAWGTFVRDLPESLHRFQWIECKLDILIVGFIGTLVLVILSLIFSYINRLFHEIRG